MADDVKMVPLETNVVVVKDGDFTDPWFEQRTRIKVPEVGGADFVKRLYERCANKANKAAEGRLTAHLMINGVPVLSVPGLTKREWDNLRKMAQKEWDDVADGLLKRDDDEKKGKGHDRGHGHGH